MRTQGIRFSNGPKIHPFEISAGAFPVNAQVVVQSRRGLEIGTVRSDAASGDTVPAGHIKRTATPEDLARWEELKREADDLKWFLRNRARERGLQVKVVAVEFTLDGTSVTISYSSEGRVELRGLTTDLAARTPALATFHAVGARDQARILGTLGSCGQENCSSLHLQDFAPVTIRMSRDQQLPLNPEKISGPCGRLLCCLQYEHDMYKELLAGLPRKGAKVCSTEGGACGKVAKLNPLKGTVEVRTEEGQWFEARPEELRPA
ncbi:MAG TPA: stage 0 sporulation family protein [Deinococcales bacterium]|nr:stage 0 sporulation family protein [Deinococcales bacterium]